MKLPKEILAKFLYPKKFSGNYQKFQTQKNPSIIPITLNGEYPPWDFASLQFKINSDCFIVE